MKRMPLIVLIFLMLLVVISGIVDPDDMRQYPDDREGRNDLLSPPFDQRDGHESRILVIPITPVPSVDADQFLENNIEGSEAMVKRLDDAVIRLKAEDNDVSELEQRVADYSVLVSEAREYMTMAESSSTEEERQEYLELSRESIILANHELKPIFETMKTYLPGPVVITDGSSLLAEGSGIAILSGDLDADISIQDGKFSVVDFSGDLQIETEYDYDQESIPDMGPDGGLARSHKVSSYRDVTGNVSLSGSAYSVAVMADGIDMIATGTGEAELVGNGTYHIYNGTSSGKENVWVKPIFGND
ncbi:hypothetical protein [Methanolobus sp. WCC4]|uniref:hypothetical protein n=1 Tax=Methanolobus sp. WCC4 TaxID=3125784 RepID=UPI0030F9B343